MVRWTTSWT